MTATERWPKISADDEAIGTALREASVPALMAAMVHLTGDASIIRGAIRPHAELFGDEQAGISLDHQEIIRQQALQAIAEYRDRGCTLPTPPDSNTVREVTEFMVGESLPSDYVDLLLAELSMDGQDPFGQTGIDDIPANLKEKFKVLVIGAGMSGIVAGCRLKEAGIPFVILEKNAGVGGTWFENTYPGCRVDSPNHIYSYSFAPKDWPQHYSSQEVLRDYFDRCSTEFKIRDNIRFQTEVKLAEFSQQDRTWTVSAEDELGRSHTFEANAIISAVGQLNRPRFPDIPGRESFDGVSFHSAQWQHQHSFKGKKIAVVGTGASAFQLVPEIARQAGEIMVFQRTPPWVALRKEYHDEIPEGKHWLLNNVPFYAKWFRFLLFWRTSEGLLKSVRRDPDWNDQRSVSANNDAIRIMLTENIKAAIGDDPELLEKVIPQYPPAGKRMLIDNGTWFRALKRDNVRVITDRISEITPTGLVTMNHEGIEQSYAVDMIIYGTGFLASRIMWPMTIKGMGGVDLHEHWGEDPRAYLGITIPHFPNLFCLYGPNTNLVVNGSIIFFSECEVRYILGCIGLLLAKGHLAMDCKEDVHDAYNERIDAGNLEMAWGAPNVNSWYKNSKGRVTQSWPFTLLEFWTQTRSPRPDDYTFM